MVKKSRVVLIAALCLVSGVLLPWGSAFGMTQVPGNGQSSTGIIRYGTPNPAATHIVVQGVKTSGGCQFVLTGQGAAGDQAVTEFQETSYDPATCQSSIDEIQTSAPVSPTTSSANDGAGQSNGLNGTPSVSPAVAKCANPDRDTHHSYSHDNCIDSWFQDVVGKHLTEVRNEVQWNPANGCASSGRAFASWYATWLANDGWFEDFSNFVPSFNCSGVRSALLDSNISGDYGIEFENDIFCALSETTTWFASQITGHGNGSYSWSVGWEKVGACEGLLSWHAQAS